LYSASAAFTNIEPKVHNHWKL